MTALVFDAEALPGGWVSPETVDGWFDASFLTASSGGTLNFSSLTATLSFVGHARIPYPLHLIPYTLYPYPLIPLSPLSPLTPLPPLTYPQKNNTIVVSPDSDFLN